MNQDRIEIPVAGDSNRLDCCEAARQMQIADRDWTSSISAMAGWFAAGLMASGLQKDLMIMTMMMMTAVVRQPKKKGGQ